MLEKEAPDYANVNDVARQSESTWYYLQDFHRHRFPV
jgi:hypothetical protein